MASAISKSAMTESHTIFIQLPTGPLGIAVDRDVDGMCSIVRVVNPASPLQVGDKIALLNGINLSAVEGASPKIWAKLITAFSNIERKLVVYRDLRRGNNNESVASNASADVVPGRVSSNPAVAQTQEANYVPRNPLPKPEVTTSNAKAVITAKSTAPERDTSTPVAPYGGNANFFSKSNTNAAIVPGRVSSNPAVIDLTQEAPAVAMSNANVAVAPERVILSTGTKNSTPSWEKYLLDISKQRAAAMVTSKTNALKPSTKHNAQTKKAGKPNPVFNPMKKPRKKNAHEASFMHLLQSGLPQQGFVSPDRNFYVTIDNDTYRNVADKLGLDDWKLLADDPFNLQRYGKVTNGKKFFPNTVLRIPTKLCSKWKLNKMVDNSREELKVMAKCSKCKKDEQPGDTDQMLLCDGCDAEMHVSCAGMTGIPEGDWLCGDCLMVLDARRKSQKETADRFKDSQGIRSLATKITALPPLDAETSALATLASRRFAANIHEKRELALRQLQENQLILAAESQKRVARLKTEMQEIKENVNREQFSYNAAKNRIMDRYGLVDWRLSKIGDSYIVFKNKDGSIERVARTKSNHGNITSPNWQKVHNLLLSADIEFRRAKRPLENAQSQLPIIKIDLDNAEMDERERLGVEESDRQQLLLEFAALLGEAKLEFETVKQFDDRVRKVPLFLGIVLLQDDDVRVLNFLQEPTELVIAVPVNCVETTFDKISVQSGMEYYLFTTAQLFSSERNDQLPLDFSHGTSMRGAQRDLMSMLLRDPRNRFLQVSSPRIPSSVHRRGSRDESQDAISKCFDLSELVRDCNYPISNQPKASTPKRLGDHGLVLRDYQKASLQWLIDKENNPSGLGSSGELWSRMRVLDNKAVTFYYCELTGTIVDDIFDYHSDVAQKDASNHSGDAFPTAAIIGSEMGLGKTVIALSLVFASPPPIQNRILPREYVARIKHPAYLRPPSIAHCSSTHGKVLLSNATLVIAPMTLCAQWKGEVERFAPWMSSVTLHNDEDESTEEIASKDIVIVSTFLLSSSGNNYSKTAKIMKKLRSIHFHRIFLDESHYNNTGKRTIIALAQLSATHRYCVTGTPVGHSLADLYGQLRFLRIPQFCRPNFWSNNIDAPYSERNYDALRILRSLLSHVVIRHSKEQTVNNGEALISLPPRTVETLLLPFGSEAEKQMYEYIEDRNTDRFKKLRAESPNSVLGKWMDLNGMLGNARHACAHPSLVNLDSMHNLNLRCGKAGTCKKAKKGTTRATILKEATSKALVSARGRMREIVLRIQEGEIELIQCPICLEATGEKELALTHCAHTFCGECILSCLEVSSSSREPAGNCPECRQKFLRSDITFLGDAEDIASTDCDLKPKANEMMEDRAEINGFQLLTKDICMSASDHASHRRALYEPLTDKEKRTQRSYCHTLDTKFLASWNAASITVGTKIARLLKEITLMNQKDPTSKCVVFSQFIGILDIAGQEMTVRDMKHARLDGSMKQHQRADAILDFSTDPHTRVLLLSMRAGAAGLNLMAADHCFLMDPAKNSAIEEQAIDRIHRIGQTRPVVVKRFIMKGTVEERILSTRRALAADRPSTSAQLDGSFGLMEDDEDVPNRPEKRSRREDEDNMGEKKFHRLQELEALFGCSATPKVFKA